ncbi:hypothetical protein [Sediminicurvatus halobius]|uniref:Uncharacterized protein n=1 Tax=Sediminicurvatus halobius TaxID=2182432 RepID=A0A2U2N600_9GAMM|nr:hypothetical protein [Spiribacter halobius]PWG64540.1 hypothetical protein DEM34_04220 [Spiribacter halobius]UEX79137.1 hypothetical protein LMH63_05700 [Spiribacter halobius]
MPQREAGEVAAVGDRQATATAESTPRRDLSPRALRVLGAGLGGGIVLALLSVLASDGAAPGTPLRQSLAIAGSLLLLVPLAFSLGKRSGRSRRTPAWFSAHVLASALGAVLVTAHAAAGDLLSPPGLVWLALMGLLAQGLAARLLLSRPLSTLFSSRLGSFREAEPDLRERLRVVIRRKQTLLAALDPAADEALFSPNLRHALRHPWLTWRYARLAATEARLVGRGEAGLVLAYWRRTHIALALLFLLGLIGHVVLVLFFAGYVAGDGPVDWWHVAAWGG